ncbi:PD-(D/E)XK nuclease family protein [Lacticaseibacillus pantheris]|uniref:PD-(D/E)XK nuclease family protein n=1 Tax=Lacticaseibacillus pantheris TaxID=171523 RepID=UPI0034E1EB5E
MSSLDYTNSVGELAPQLAHALYGNHLEVSISRLESFYRNPYEYFLKYGLALAPRPEFALTPADTGTLFHAVLDELNRQAADKGGIENLSDAELDQLVQQLVADKSTEPGFEVLTSSKRMLFIRDLLTALLTQSARASVTSNGNQASRCTIPSSLLAFPVSRTTCRPSSWTCLINNPCSSGDGLTG